MDLAGRINCAVENKGTKGANLNKTRDSTAIDKNLSINGEKVAAFIYASRSAMFHSSAYPDLFFIKLAHLQILIMCAVPPVEMLACMLKVSECWRPTKPRLIGADRQSQQMPKAHFSIWLSFLFSSSQHKALT